MGESESEKDSIAVVPPFRQIIAAASHAFGRGDGEFASTDVLYGLDGDGRVWEWSLGDPEREGSADGWQLLPNTPYQDGKEPPAQRKTR
jgi:hypothetical protein